MTSILKNTYATQDIISDLALGSVTYTDILITDLITERVEDMDASARKAGDEIDWGTLAISTRWDGLVDGLIVSCRVNPL